MTAAEIMLRRASSSRIKNGLLRAGSSSGDRIIGKERKERPGSSVGQVVGQSRKKTSHLERQASAGLERLILAY